MDLDKIYSPSSDTSHRIKAISQKNEFKDYFNKNLVQIRREKIRTKEVKQLPKVLSDSLFDMTRVPTKASDSRPLNHKTESEKEFKRSIDCDSNGNKKIKSL